MKQPTHQIARELGVHPANLIFRLAALGAPFDEVWPEVDASWIDAVRQSAWEQFGLSRPQTSRTNVAPPPISSSAIQVLSKLWRQRCFGSHTASLDVIKNHWCKTTPNVEEAIRELGEVGYLQIEGSRGPYSLNSARSGEIERIARQVADRSG